MRPINVTVSSQTESATIPVDWRENDFKVSLAVVISGTLTYTVEHTFDNIQDPAVTPTWFPNSTLTALSANGEASLVSPVRAVRLNVTAFTSGSATLTVIQSGGR